MISPRLCLLAAALLAAPVALATVGPPRTDLAIVLLEDVVVREDALERWHRTTFTVTNEGPDPAWVGPWRAWYALRADGNAGQRVLFNSTSVSTHHGDFTAGDSRTVVVEWEATGLVGGTRLVAEAKAGADGAWDGDRSDNVRLLPLGAGPVGADALGVAPLRSDGTSTGTGAWVCIPRPTGIPFTCWGRTGAGVELTRAGAASSASVRQCVLHACPVDAALP